MSGVNISKRRKFIADGVFYAELNEFFQRELAEEGYSGVEVRVTPTVTDIIIRATHTQEVLGEQGRRIREVSKMMEHNTRYLTEYSLPASSPTATDSLRTLSLSTPQRSSPVVFPLLHNASLFATSF